MDPSFRVLIWFDNIIIIVSFTRIYFIYIVRIWYNCSDWGWGVWGRWEISWKVTKPLTSSKVKFYYPTPPVMMAQTKNGF